MDPKRGVFAPGTRQRLHVPPALLLAKAAIVAQAHLKLFEQATLATGGRIVRQRTLAQP